MQNKIVIIGCGNVGMSYAYALLNQKTKVTEIILIDIDQSKIIGEAMDLNHGLAFSLSNLKIKVGTYQDCATATIILISAGVKQKPNESRLKLLTKNATLLKDIISKVMATGFNGIFLIATNPVDIMSYLTFKYSNLDHHKIIGSGTCLDTARLRYIISQKLKLNPKNIHAYVIGEHGDSEVIPWSNAYIGSVNINKYLSATSLEHIACQVRTSAYHVIAHKGATYYAIGLVLVSITNAILDDDNSILTVSSYDFNNDIYIGQPAVIGKKGIKKVMPIVLTKEEELLFSKSITNIKKAITKLT